MDNAYKSLDAYCEINFIFRSVRINKLNLGQYIEFVNHYKIITAQNILKSFHSNLLKNKIVKASIRECVRLATGRKSYGKLTDRAIISQTLEFNKPEKRGQAGGEKAFDPNYLQGLIHIIAKHYHWTKSEILKLYPDEVVVYADNIMRDIKLKYKEHALFIVDLDYIVSKSVVSKSGGTKLLASYQASRKKILSDDGNEFKVGDLEAFKASQKAWLERNGISSSKTEEVKNGN